MHQLHSNTDDTSRKRGAHLTLDQRGAIQILKRQGLSLRARVCQEFCVNFFRNLYHTSTLIRSYDHL